MYLHFIYLIYFILNCNLRLLFPLLYSFPVVNAENGEKSAG